MVTIARRILTRVQRGPNAGAARRRIEGSAALADAVARGDAAATSAALTPLLRAQIHRIVITRGGQVLAAAGSTAALAPLRGTLRGPSGAVVGRYVLSVGSDAGLAGTIRGVTGAGVAMRAGGRVVMGAWPHGAGGHATLAATAFPSGRLAVAISPPAGIHCAPGATGATLAADLVVAHRILADETSGSPAKAVLVHVAHDPGFRAAVAQRDPAALRAAIVRFFQDPRLHVVRIRAVTPSGRLINDVGGPYVVSPTSKAVVSPSGHALGRVTLSIQDDAGYVKLLHGFTGAQVVLRTPAGPVPSSTIRTTVPLPSSGTATIAGRTYAVGSLTGTVFPTGPLRIWVLVPR